MYMKNYGTVHIRFLYVLKEDNRHSFLTVVLSPERQVCGAELPRD